MQTKAAIIGLAGLFVVATGVLAMGEKPESEALDAGSTATLPQKPVTSPLAMPGSCPSTANSVLLTFADAHTDATRAAIKAHDEEARMPEHAKADKPRAIQFIDLNNDGAEDFLALYQGSDFCGSSGCLVEIFINDGKGGYAGSNGFYGGKKFGVVLESLMNGYRQLMTPVQSRGLPGEQRLWRWNGSSYVNEVRCLGDTD